MRLHVSRLRGSRGLTLVEVCLVLALFVVIGAIAAPVMQGTFARASLRGGGDILRGAWAKARLAAMKSGQTYVFRCEPLGGRFQIISLDQLGAPESQALNPEDPDADHAPSDMLRLRQSRLPDGVIFAKADVSSSAQLTALMGSSDGGPWSAPILFRADGTTSDASIVLQIANGQTIRTTLRGLTGTSIASDVGRENFQ